MEPLKTDGHPEMAVRDPKVHDVEEASSPWKDAYRSLKRNKMAVFGAGIIFFFICVAILAPLFTSYKYDATDLMNRLLPPSSAHWFG